MPSDVSGGEESDDCWFLMCSRPPDGVLHGENGDAVAACEQHGEAGEAFGWERFERFEAAE